MRSRLRAPRFVGGARTRRLRPGRRQHAGERVAARHARLRLADRSSRRPSRRSLGADTVMRMLERNAAVGDALSAAASSSRIDGFAGGGGSDWFYYVNGVQAPKGAADTKLHAGDHVWWDRHDWSRRADHPRGRRRLPGAVRRRLRRASGCRCGSSARRPTRASVQRGPERVRRLPPRRVRGLPAVLAVQPVAARRRRSLRRRSAADPAAGAARRARRGERRVRALHGRRAARSSCWTSSGRVVQHGRRRGGPRRRDALARAAAGLVRDRHRCRRRQRRGQAFNAQTLDQHFAVAVVDGSRDPAPDRRRELPAPREPAARGARVGVGAAYCARARSSRRSRSPTRSCSPCSRWPSLAAGAAAGVGRRVARSLWLSVPMAVLVVVDQRARQPRRPDRARAARRRRAASASSTSRSRRSSTAPRQGLVLIVIVAVCALASAAVDPDEVLRSMRRRLVSLGADGDDRDADGAAARARRAADRRGAALPPGAGRAPRRDARDHDQRARPLARHRGHARGPRLRTRAASGAPQPPVLAPRCWRSLASSAAVLALTFAVPLHVHLLPPDPGRHGRARRAARRRPRARRARTVRAAPGDRPMKRARARSRLLPLPGRPRPGARRGLARARAGRVRRSSRARRRRASRRCSASRAGSSRTSTAAPSTGRAEICGMDLRDHGPAELSPRRRDALPGPRDAGRDGDGPRLSSPSRSRTAAHERGRRRPRGRGGRAGAGHRGAARPHDRRRSRAASSSASRSAPRSPAARACWCSTSRPRSWTRSRATSCSRCCAASTRSGGRRSCSPSTASSAAWAPPTA